MRTLPRRHEVALPRRILSVSEESQLMVKLEPEIWLSRRRWSSPSTGQPASSEENGLNTVELELERRPRTVWA